MNIERNRFQTYEYNNFASELAQIDLEIYQYMHVSRQACNFYRQSKLSELPT